MSTTDQFHIIQLSIGLGLLFFVYPMMYARTRLDSFREDLFSLRDELFDYMWKYELPYSMPAYQALRNALNGHIRFARKTWLLALWLTLLVSRKEKLHMSGEARTPTMGEIEKISDAAVRSYFRSVYQRMGSRVLDYIFLEGPLWLFAILIKKYLRRRGIAEAQRRMGFDVMVDEAAQLGKPDSARARQLLYP